MPDLCHAAADPAVEVNNMTIEGFLIMAGRGFVEPLLYLVILGVLLFGYKLIHDRITEYDDDHLLRQGNKAVAITRAGAYLGVAIAATGSLINTDEQTYWERVGTFALNGIFAVGVLTTAVILFDFVIVRHAKNSTLIADGNYAVGFLEACSYVSMGLITCASFSGDGQGFWPGIGSAALFSLVGLITLAVIYLAYCWFWQRFKRCDVDGEVAQGNLAAAIDAGMLLIAMSVTLWFSISGDFTGWANDLASYVLAVLSSTLVVPFGRVLASKVFARTLRSTDRRSHHGSVTKSLVVGFVSVATGLTVGLIQFI